MITVMKRTDLLESGSDYLAKQGIENSKAEAEIFLSHALNCPRVQLYLNNFIVKEKRFEYFWQLLTKRAKGLPLQYLVGSTEFMGLEFKVRPGVFIPRPETEILVQAILSLQLTTYNLQLKVLDIGTGCGNIAVSCAKYLRSAHIFACDICDSALETAKENAFLNKTKIFLIKSNLFSAFKKSHPFSLIVSNPPYINTQQIPNLAQEIHYEPKEALDGGRDGLYYYRRIINQAPEYLKNRAYLALEIGDGQIDSVKEIFLQSEIFSSVSVFEDYNKIKRVIIAQKK